MNIDNIKFLIQKGILADGVNEWFEQHGLVYEKLASYIKTNYDKDPSKFDELISLYFDIISEYKAKITRWKSIICYFMSNSNIILSKKFEIFLKDHCHSSKKLNNEGYLNFLNEILDRSTFDDTLFYLLSYTPKIQQFFVDISGSTENHSNYHSYVLSAVESVLRKENEFSILILYEWETNCSNLSFQLFQQNRIKKIAKGGTNPYSIVEFINIMFPGNTVIHFFTDGQIDLESINKFDSALKKKVDQIKFLTVCTYIISTGGRMDFSCTKPVEILSDKINRYIDEGNGNITTVSATIDDVLELIDSVTTIDIFLQKYDELLMLLTLFNQGLAHPRSLELKKAMIKLKTLLVSRNIPEEKKSLNIEINSIVSSMFTQEITESDFFSKLHVISKKMISPFSDDTWSSKIDKLIQITNGLLHGNYALRTSVTGLVGTDVERHPDLDDSIPTDISKEQFSAILESSVISECMISMEREIPVVPFGNESIVPNGTNLNSIRQTPFLISQNIGEFNVMPWFGFSSIRSLQNNEHPTTRKQIKTSIFFPPLNSLESIDKEKVIAYNNAVFQIIFFGEPKYVVNPAYLFVILFWQMRDIEWLQEFMPFISQHLDYYLNHTNVCASMLAPDAKFPSMRISLRNAMMMIFYLGINSCINDSNVLLAHLPYIYFVKNFLQDVCHIPIDPKCLQYADMLILFKKVERIFKTYQGKKNPLLFFLRCWHQNVASYQNVKIIFLDYETNIFPIDGAPTEDSRALVLSEVKSFLKKDFPIYMNVLEYIVSLFVGDSNEYVSHIITPISMLSYDSSTNFVSTKSPVIKNWTYNQNLTMEGLHTEIDIKTGLPIPFQNGVDAQSLFGSKFLSMNRIFHDLSCDLGRFATVSELLNYICEIYFFSKKELTLPSQIILLAESTVDDYRVYDAKPELFHICFKKKDKKKKKN